MIKVRSTFLLLLLFCFSSLYAQSGTAPVEMDNGMMSSGKIYVVVAVVLIILVGLFIYLISIDRKVSRMEKEIEQGKKS